MSEGRVIDRIGVQDGKRVLARSGDRTCRKERNIVEVQVVAIQSRVDHKIG